ncbi:unnamed protein product [Staurois parvus]|uniref:Uncharacterized protein n=1 Tax=Staurois parvus TaxID=386267 RepID=A0ABN9BE44_9NEOB|nr:unnamed protein product [Staurois parvus]
MPISGAICKTSDTDVYANRTKSSACTTLEIGVTPSESEQHRYHCCNCGQ